MTKTFRIGFTFTKGSMARFTKHFSEKSIRHILKDGALEELERRLQDRLKAETPKKKNPLAL